MPISPYNTPMDTILYEAINGLAGHHQIADVLFTVLGSYGPFLLLGLLALLWFWPGERLVRDRRQQMISIAVLSVAVALLINQIIIHLWNRPRPFVAHAATLLLPPSNEPSFPSDHATFSFALAIGLLGVAQRVGVLSLLLATLIAFARVYTGEHYVSDVAAGALIGGSVALLLAWATPYLAPVIAPLVQLARRLHLA